MKKSIVLLIVLALIGFLVVPAFAGEIRTTSDGATYDRAIDTHTNEKNAEERKYTVGFYKPKLVRLTENTYLSTRFGKDVHSTKGDWEEGGWYGGVEIMNDAVGFDARKIIGFINPLNWFKE